MLIRTFIKNDNRKHPDEMETEQVGPSAKSFTPFVGVGEDFSDQGGRSCAGAWGAPAEKFGLGRKF